MTQLFSRPALIKELVSHEGLRLAVYDDATGKPIEAGDTLVGNPTIGVGRLLTAARGISEAEAFMLLDADIAEVERQLDHHIAWWRDLDASRQRAMLSWSFNVGVGGVMQFKKALAAIRSGDWQEAHDQMLDSRWARQVPRRAEDLAKVMLRG